MAEAASQSNTRKLDEILKRLEGQPSIEEWHDLTSTLLKAVDKLDRIDGKVDKLDKTVITGNGEPPLKQRVHDLEKDVAGYNKLTWIVIGAGLTSVIGIFVYLAQTHALP